MSQRKHVLQHLQLLPDIQVNEHTTHATPLSKSNYLSSSKAATEP